MADTDDAEKVYFDVFSLIAENADYFQPRRGVDFLMPEVVVASLTATVVVEFLKGFFGELGKGLAGLVKERIFNSGKLRDVEPPVLVDELAKRMAEIRRQPERIEVARIHVRQELIHLGASPDVGEKMSTQITAIITKGI